MVGICSGLLRAVLNPYPCLPRSEIGDSDVGDNAGDIDGDIDGDSDGDNDGERDRIVIFDC